jgi:uncharacterized coiled-coil DUF342 family protein
MPAKKRAVPAVRTSHVARSAEPKRVKRASEADRVAELQHRVDRYHNYISTIQKAADEHRRKSTGG